MMVVHFQVVLLIMVEVAVVEQLQPVLEEILISVEMVEQELQHQLMEPQQLLLVEEEVEFIVDPHQEVQVLEELEVVEMDQIVFRFQLQMEQLILVEVLEDKVMLLLEKLLLEVENLEVQV